MILLMQTHFSPAGNPPHEFWTSYPPSNQPPTSTPTTTQQYQPNYNEPVEMVACTINNQIDDVRHHNDENRQILSAQIQNERSSRIFHQVIFHLQLYLPDTNIKLKVINFNNNSKKYIQRYKLLKVVKHL